MRVIQNLDNVNDLDTRKLLSIVICKKIVQNNYCTVGEKVSQMSLEAIEKVTQTELKTKERKTAAEAEAKQQVANAEREGLALLQQARARAAEDGKKLLRQAEESAAKHAAEIAAAAQADAGALRDAAGKHLEEAAEFIVGRVVKH